MTDDRLRLLERRFRETGAVEDEAIWLTERARVGLLDTARLRLAAALRQPAALRAVGPQADPPWPALIAAAGIEGSVRLVLAYTKGLLACYAAKSPGMVLPLAWRNTLDLIECWLRNPASVAPQAAQLEVRSFNRSKEIDQALRVLTFLIRAKRAGGAARQAAVFMPRVFDRADRPGLLPALRQEFVPWLLA